MHIRKSILFSIFAVLIAIASSINSLPTKAAEASLTLVWQTKFDADSILLSPGDITVDKWGNAYVSTQGNNEIKKFDPNGNFLLKWGERGKGKGKFDLALGLGTDSEGNVYVTDFFNKLIQKFDGQGKFLQQWETEPSTSPAFMDIDANDNIYIDQFPPYDTHFIQKFDKTGKLISEWGKEGGRFKGRVEDIALDKDGNLYVAEAFSQRIQKLDPDGNLIASFGGKADMNGQGLFYVPAGIDVDSDGNIYVLDNYFVQKLDWQGKFIAQWPRKGDLDEAANITIDAEGNLYVLAKAEVQAVTGAKINAFVLKKFKAS
jgi:tripartite motif-containing protein 71